VGYLPPALDTAAKCGPSQRGCRSSSPDSLVFSLPEANRSGRLGRVQKNAPLVLLPARAPPVAPQRKEANNWDFYLQSGLVARKG
jgi:hypothetical protein